MAEQTADQQKPHVWKKIFIVGGAVLGGLAGWYYAGTSDEGWLGIVAGVFVGALLADWVWDFSQENGSK